MTLDNLICNEAKTTSGGTVAGNNQYCNLEPVFKEGKHYCPLFDFEVTPFAYGCSCRIEAYRKVRGLNNESKSNTHNKL